jgi:hypothetical protein
MVTIPRLVGRTLADADAIAESLGLMISPESVDPYEPALADLGRHWIICTQEPAPGATKRLGDDSWGLSVGAASRGNCD